MIATSIQEESVVLEPERTVAQPRKAAAFHLAEHVLLGISSVFYALHFLHLRADFPNQSPWTDWAKYTDEGWYGDAAIRHFQWGHWDVPGDFNPAAALPVWPALETALFRVTGVSLIAARMLTVVIFGLILMACYWLLRRWANTQPHRERPSLAPALAVMLLATSPFCYAFTRMAILEPLLILLTLCALLLAGRIRGGGTETPAKLSRARMLSPIALGIVLPLMVLTKTTGVFLFPAIFFVLWISGGRNWKSFLHSASISGGTGAALWLAYYGLFVRPHFLEDYRYLFDANAYTKITAVTFWAVLGETLTDGTWIGDALFWSSLSALLGWLAVSVVRRFRGSPIPAALVLWVFGYAAFLAYHANLASRYYLVLAVPLTLLLAMGIDSLPWSVWTSGPRQDARSWLFRLVAAGSALTLLFVVADGAQQTLAYVAHPEYTFLSAVHHLQDEIERQTKVDPSHPRLVLSISGSDISMITGLHSICDDFGTMELPDRVAAYKPGWFAAWNEVEDDKMAALDPMYRLVRVAAYPAFDDPERNLLILYRLDPVSSPQRGRSGRRRYFVSPKRRPARPARPRAAVGPLAADLPQNR